MQPLISYSDLVFAIRGGLGSRSSRLQLKKNQGRPGCYTKGGYCTGPGPRSEEGRQKSEPPTGATTPATPVTPAPSPEPKKDDAKK